MGDLATSRNRRGSRSVAVALVAATLAALPSLARAQDTTAAAAPSLEERLNELDQQVRILQRLRELERDSLVAAKAKGESNVTTGRQGFLIKSSDGKFQLRIGGNIQADGRFYPGDGNPALTNAFLLRRVRPILEATVYQLFEARLMPDFAEGRVQLFDAYVGARVLPGLQFRAGKFKGPISLERLQSQSVLVVVERAVPTQIAPNRELGLSVGGDLLGGRVRYDVGLFDGVVDGSSTDGDLNDSKDGHARIFVTPFLAPAGGGLSGLGFGVAATVGEEHGSPAAPALALYRTEAQTTFFTYRSDATAPNTAFADGRRTRVAPQAYYYAGPLGLMAEWIRSAQIVNRAGTLAPISAKAWQATGSFALTGDPASYTGLAPRKPVSGGGLGAVELVVRAGQLQVDDEAFPLFADPTRSARKATEWAVGVNWHFERRIKLAANYIRTTFDGGAAAGDREAEDAILTRFQVAF